MQVVPGGFRLLKKPRTAAWRTLAISVLALAFPATAVAAGSGPAQPTTSASTQASGAPSRVAHVRLGDSVLALGSGYNSPGGSRLVRVVQRDLEAGGYPPGRVDGLYGPLRDTRWLRSKRRTACTWTASWVRARGPRSMTQSSCWARGQAIKPAARTLCVRCNAAWRLPVTRRVRSMAAMAC